MGWSCAAAAGDTMDKWTAACRAQTGSSNTFKVDGQEFFFEQSNREHDDGAITGTIWLMLTKKPDGSGTVRKAGTFRIEGDGSVKRAPAFLKKASN